MKRLLLGPRAVTEGLRAAPDQVSVVYLASGGGQAHRDLQALCARRGVRLEERSRQELDAIAKGGRHQGVLAIAGEFSYLALADLVDDAGDAPLLIALDQITDPHNLGAIIRSAVALGADGVITLKDRAARINKTVTRVAAGATEAARVARVTNLARTLERLSETGLQIIGLDAAGDTALCDVPYPPAGRVLVIGAEGSGLRRLTRLRCDRLARIPLRGPVQSLNASAAAAIAIYDSLQKRRENFDGSQEGDETG